jgi:hypothetical protein
MVGLDGVEGERERERERWKIGGFLVFRIRYVVLGGDHHVIFFVDIFAINVRCELQAS